MPIFGGRSYLAFLVALTGGCAAPPAAPAAKVEETKPEPTPDPAPEAVPLQDDPPAPEPEPKPPPRDLPDRYLTFDGACDPGEVVTIAAVGDIMSHRELQRQAYRDKKLHFRAIWAGIEDLLGQTDISYANLETPLAHGIKRNGELGEDPGMRFDNDVYSGYARFNAHRVMAKDLAAAGFDIVSLANNHALDRGSLGVDHTIDALNKAKIKHTGTRKKGSKAPLHTVTEAKGIRIAWLACTLHTNYGKDEHDQVLYCFKGNKVAKTVAKLAKNPKIDAVIVTPHWGKEYSPEPSDGQLRRAQEWVDAGATAIIGSHPHVLEPWDKLTTADGREAFVIYSLGNFMSHQRTLNRRSTIILYLGLRKGADGTVKVVGARYTPLHVRMEGDKKAFFVESIDRKKGPADARALIVRMYGKYNLLPPDDPPVVNAHCDADWEFPKR